ncbi:BlaI/MecI/CopY family transcriptional regulator [Nonomuraea longicatena]|uniref:Transcriptional regulator n=1 Tax=Nonomuraea longicatena TaxID=83682 RepID=A0ABN1QPW5_9ACTN
MRLGSLERSVMEALWSRPGGLLAQDIADGLATAPAVTTVLTVLSRLTRKGLAVRERAGRAHVYRPVAGKDTFVAEAMREALNEAGDVAAAVHRFVGTISPEAAAALRAALDAADGGP